MYALAGLQYYHLDILLIQHTMLGCRIIQTSYQNANGYAHEHKQSGLSQREKKTKDFSIIAKETS